MCVSGDLYGNRILHAHDDLEPTGSDHRRNMPALQYDLEVPSGETKRMKRLQIILLGVSIFAITGFGVSQWGSVFRTLHLVENTQRMWNRSITETGNELYAILFAQKIREEKQAVADAKERTRAENLKLPVIKVKDWEAYKALIDSIWPDKTNKQTSNDEEEPGE
jgi:hypothetical protein